MTSEPTLLRTWLSAARDAVSAHRYRLDEINVFPIADSDTGTNLWLTLHEGVGFAAEAGSEATEEQYARAFERGAVLGARGNSGVILSQYMSGLLDSLMSQGGLATADAPRVARALAAGSAAAFDAVGIPVDGTMVTVAAAAAQAAADAAAAPGADLAGVLREVVGQARAALTLTREQLPAARDAGVIDAGAWGLVMVLETLLEAVDGPQDLPEVDWRPAGDSDMPVPFAEAAPTGPDGAERASHVHAAPGGGVYEVMFVSGNTDPDGATADDAPGAGWRELAAQLGELGDSVAVTGIRGLVQAHVHTNVPDEVVEIADTLGSSQILVRNIVVAHERGVKAVGVVALTRAPGLAAAMADAGAVVLVIPANAGLTDREFSRAVRDASDSEVVIAAADPELRLAASQLAEGRTAPEVMVLRAEHEAQVIAAVTAGLLAGADPHAHDAMAAAVRDCAVGSSTVDALGDDVERLLGSAVGGEVEVLTVILPQGVSDAVAETARQVASTRAPETQVNVYQGRHLTGGILLGAERPA